MTRACDRVVTKVLNGNFSAVALSFFLALLLGIMRDSAAIEWDAIDDDAALHDPRDDPHWAEDHALQTEMVDYF
eukprot:SAG31_NODE_37446_length_304_cov_0.760976_1_plen_73_part_10